jgi:signal transduction histidine kinase
MLLVEDRPADARLFELLLQSLDEFEFTFSHVDTLAAALFHLQQSPTDVVVLDLSLPDAERILALDQIRQDFPDIPVIIHSALEEHNLVVEAMKHGAYDYLIKDRYKRAHLESIISAILEDRWVRQGLSWREDRLHRIIESTSDGMVVISAEGRIKFFNQAAQQLLQWRRQDLLGAPFGHPLVDNTYAELDIPHADGSMHVVEMRITAIKWHSQEALLASLRDVTARRQLEDALVATRAKAEALAQLKSSFLANMSHELRTPLATILGFAQTLMEEVPDTDHQEFAAIIKQEGQRLFGILESILQLSQLESGTLEIDCQDISVSDVVHDVMDDLQRQAEAKGIQLLFRSMQSNVEVHVDRLLLQRVIHHLLDNAIKFTSEGQVLITVMADGNFAYLTVEDTGIGIESSFLNHLFQPFRQQSSGLTRTHSGNGLGLAITKKLVTLMGGAIGVESNVGEGTTFTVSFPTLAKDRVIKLRPSAYMPGTTPR